jgi:nitroreductase
LVEHLFPRAVQHESQLAPNSESLSFFRERFSPMRFRTDNVISDAVLDLLLDAARLAPSAGNSQPWAFVVGRRGDKIHHRLTRYLARSSSLWAPTASVLIVNLARILVDDSDFEYSEYSLYDAGQAVAYLTFQAHALDLQVHQFRAFDRDAVRVEFEIPRSWEIVSMSAVGQPAHSAGEVVGNGTDRTRRSLEEVTWARETHRGAAKANEGIPG